MVPHSFEQLAERAYARIPEHFRQQLQNVAIVIQDAPTPTQLRSGRVRAGSTLLGLYEGVPRTAREGRAPLLPDRITLFQRSIEAIAGDDPTRLFDQVTVTLWHELGHHFGLSDREIRRVERRILQHPH